MEEEEGKLREDNYAVFRECLASAILDQQAAPPKKNVRKPKRNKGFRTKEAARESVTGTIDQPRADAEELADFIDFIATEIFYSLPPSLQTLSYSAYSRDLTLQERYTPPLSTQSLTSLIALLPPVIPDTLTAYSVPNGPSAPGTNSTADAENLVLTFLSRPLDAFLTSMTTAPPPPKTTRTTACELCERDWIPLTYHHLIPRSTWPRVLKRAWHSEDRLQDVAWLCRACHSFVHRTAENEDLAKEYFTVERLRDLNGVEDWVKWIGGVRWKKR